VDSGVGGLENAEDFVGALMSDGSSPNDLTPWEELLSFIDPLKYVITDILAHLSLEFSFHACQIV